MDTTKSVADNNKNEFPKLSILPAASINSNFNSELSHLCMNTHSQLQLQGSKEHECNSTYVSIAIAS